VNEQIPTATRAASRTTTRIFVIVGLLIGVVLLLSLALPAFNPERKGPSPRVMCAFHLHQIGLAIGLYADEHSGKIPQTFDDLQPYASNLNKLAICPAAKDTSRPSYQILAGGQKWSSWSSLETTNTIVVTEPISNHGTGRNALYGGGQVVWLSN
jgi:hypothetical protein